MGRLGFLIDMDGVIYQGDRSIPQAIEFLEKVRKYPCLFLTNNSSTAPGSIASRLKTMGVPRWGEEHILTSATATADFLQEMSPAFSYYAVGGPGLHAALKRWGRENDQDPDYVVIGEGPGLDYKSLTKGITILLRGRARLIGTNPDVNLDGTMEGRQVVLPGGGALIAPFRVATGMDPLFVGKPSPSIYRQALKRMGKKPGDVFMIGDRPETDIKGAFEVGIRTILVTTGRFRRGDIYPDHVPRPDLIVDSLAELKLDHLESMLV